MAIIVTNKGAGTTSVVEISGFANEDVLQQYIHNHPESIPVYDIQKDKRLFIVAREFSTESGPIDALAVDRDGDIYVVETKLYSNSDKRRVVAQVLDYGASLWKHFGSFDKFLSSLDEHSKKTWKRDFQTKVQEVFELGEEDIEDLMQALESNLSRGNLKFVVLMDAIDERLKDLITYINQNSKFDIYGVKLEFYRHDEYEIVIPKLYGVETKKEVGTGEGTRRKWNEEDFFAALEASLERSQYEAVKKIYEFSKQTANSIHWGTGATGTFNPVYTRVCPRSLFSVNTNGLLAIPFGWLNGTELAEYARDDFKQQLESDLGLHFPADVRQRYPQIPIEKWYLKAKEFEVVVSHVVGHKE
jgi:TolB-like protein